MIKSLVAARDAANTAIILAQQPGSNMRPEAPGELGGHFDRGLNLAMYVGIVLAVLGVIIAGATMLISRRDGSGEEATSMALRIGIGTMLIGTAGSIVAALL